MTAALRLKDGLVTPAAAPTQPGFSLSDAAFEALRNAIVEGRLRAGEPLRQDHIAAKLGVSKIPLREALTRLEREGLVMCYLNRGYIASPLSRSEVLEAISLRLKLEPDLASRSAQCASAHERQSAREALETLCDAAGSLESYRLARVVLKTLYTPAGCPMSVAFLERLAALTHRYVIDFGLIDTATLADRYRDLLDAWVEGDPAKVEAAWSANLSEALVQFSARVN